MTLRSDPPHRPPASGACDVPRAAASLNAHPESMPASAAPATPKIPESVLVVIHTADLQVLLLERADHPGFWQSVTGSKDALEEPLETTCRREVLEETGLDTRRFVLTDWHFTNEYEIYPHWRHRYAPGVIRNVEHVFGLELPAPLPIVLSPREHVQYAWLPWRTAAHRCFSSSNAQAIGRLAAERGGPAGPAAR